MRWGIQTGAGPWRGLLMLLAGAVRRACARLLQGAVAEGVLTSRSAHHLAQKQGIECPVITGIYRVRGGRGLVGGPAGCCRHAGIVPCQGVSVGSVSSRRGTGPCRLSPVPPPPRLLFASWPSTCLPGRLPTLPCPAAGDPRGRRPCGGGDPEHEPPAEARGQSAGGGGGAPLRGAAAGDPHQQAGLRHWLLRWRSTSCVAGSNEAAVGLFLCIGMVWQLPRRRMRHPAFLHALYILFFLGVTPLYLPTT